MTKGLKFSAALCFTWKLNNYCKETYLFLYNTTQTFLTVWKDSTVTWKPVSPPGIRRGCYLNLISKPIHTIGSYSTAKPSHGNRHPIRQLGMCRAVSSDRPFQQQHQQLPLACLVTFGNHVAVCTDFVICQWQWLTLFNGAVIQSIHKHKLLFSLELRFGSGLSFLEVCLC